MNRNIVESGRAVKEYYQDLREYVKAIVHGGSNSLICYGRPGTGKSFQIESVLEEEGLERGEEYEVIKGFSTPLRLFTLLHENRRNVILLDDVDGIVSNRKALSFLQAITWSVDKERVVHYRSTTKRLGDVPQHFRFRGSVIMAINRKSTLPELKALISRSIFHKLDITHQDLIDGIFPEMAKSELDKEGQKIVDYIRDNSSPADELECRDLKKSIQLYKYAEKKGKDWKPLVDGILETDEEKALIWRLMKNEKPTKENVDTYREETGESRATFFRKKKELREIAGR